jgi:hypothetical protein
VIKVFENKQKYYRFVVLLLLSVSISAIAQELRQSARLKTEQLMQYYRAVRNSAQETQEGDLIQDRKCGFGLRTQVLERWGEFSQSQQIEFSLLMKAAVMQCDTIAGHFRIFYDTSGINTPALLDQYNNRIPGTAKAYVDSTARIFNHVWDVEIDQMGYEAPPFEPPQSYYYVYIISTDDYGATTPYTQIASSNNPARYYSYIDVNNDFQTLPTKGINGLKVTAAHEFHHAVQMGSYGYWMTEQYAYELTSTWFEDVVYPEVNDYFFYLPNYYSGFHGGLSFNTSLYRGYERVVWPIFLAKRFSPSMMLDVWTRMRTQPFLESTDAALVSIGSNLQTAFSEFTYWNYYTADRADTVKYYSEGNHYPRFQPLQKIVYTNGDGTVGGDVFPLSSSMYEFDLSSSDTLTAMIANVDVNAAELGQPLTKRVDITLFSQNYPPPYHQFENGLKARIAVADTSLWHDFFSQSSTLEYVLKRLSNLAPNPFRINNDQQLFLPVNEDEIGLANVYLYSSSLSLVYTAEVNVTYQNKSMVIAVSGADLKSKLSSGVYFVVAKTKKKDYQWKVSVIR